MKIIQIKLIFTYYFLTKIRMSTNVSETIITENDVYFDTNEVFYDALDTDEYIDQIHLVLLPWQSFLAYIWFLHLRCLRLQKLELKLILLNKCLSLISQSNTIPEYLNIYFLHLTIHTFQNLFTSQ